MVKYFGYGALKSEEVIESVIGRRPDGVPGILHDMKLCIQELKDLPAITQEIVKRRWPSNFRSYTITPEKDSAVSGVIWDITAKERAVIAEWELVETGWYTLTNVDVQNELREIVPATTEVMGEGQTYSSVVDGTQYPALLNSPEDHARVAKEVRGESL
jgi:hypothetical protein